MKDAQVTQFEVLPLFHKSKKAATISLNKAATISLNESYLLKNSKDRQS
jgi:hypothetical protein